MCRPTIYAVKEHCLASCMFAESSSSLVMQRQDCKIGPQMSGPGFRSHVVGTLLVHSLHWAQSWNHGHALQLRYSLKAKQKHSEHQPPGTWAIFRCNAPFPWVWASGFMPSRGISLSPAHLSSVPVSGIAQSQIGKNSSYGVREMKKVFGDGNPLHFTNILFMFGKYHLVAVSIFICFTISCFNSEIKCVTHQEGLGLIPDQ